MCECVCVFCVRLAVMEAKTIRFLYSQRCKGESVVLWTRGDAAAAAAAQFVSCVAP